MRPSIEVHDALARLLTYPREGYREAVEESLRELAPTCPEAWEPLAAFAEHARGTDQVALEEGFTATFDNTEERALEVGWHAFGENYARGTFLAGMRRRLREHGLAENGELPDHLSHVLALLGRADATWAGAMAADTVGPAVDKVLAALERVQSPWSGLLAAVRTVLSLHERPARRPAGWWIPETPPLPARVPAWESHHG